MQTDAVRAFVAVCDLGSFQAAAERLHLSQPAISKRLANLEIRLGRRLFDRIGRSVALTEAGAAYLPHARELLAVLQDGRRALDNLGETVGGRLRLALSHHVGLHRMPPVLKAFVQTYPAVEMDIVFMDSEGACRAVANGEREIAVITLPTPEYPALLQQQVWDDPMQIYVASEHPLAGQQAPVVTELDAFPAILPPTNSTTYGLIDAALRGHGVGVAPRMTSHYLETLRMLAGVGLGWTVLPTSMRDTGLHALEFAGLSIRRRLGVVRHPRRSLSNAARAMLGLLEQAPG